MARRMSCSMTVDAVRNRTKTVTRRHPDTWRDLAPGDRLTLIEKGMGLPKGARQVVLAEVEVTDVRVERLSAILTEPWATEREGFPEMSPVGFARMWLESHRGVPDPPICRRIEWRYLPDVSAPSEVRDA